MALLLIISIVYFFALVQRVSPLSSLESELLQLFRFKFDVLFHLFNRSFSLS